MRKGKTFPGKRVRGESEDSSLHLCAPENAVGKPEIAVLLEHGTPSITLEIEGKWQRLIVDTGSNVSILQPGVSRRDLRENPLRPFGVTGESLDVKGQQLVSFTLGGRKFDHMFLVCPLPTEAAGLIGTDFLERTGAEMNFECGRMALAGVGEAPVANSDSRGKRAALTVFSEVQFGRSIRPTGQKKLQLHYEPSEVPRFETATVCGRSWLVRTTENMTVAPRC